MIDNYLLLDAAKKQNVEISDNQVDQQIQSIASQNHMSLSQLKAATQKEGYSYAEYRHQMKDQLTINELQKKVITPAISISDEEIKSFFQQY